MILTVTPNPTIDRVVFVRDFAMQDVVRAEREVVAPSGKGIDVALVLQEMGAATHAIALNAGRHGALLAALLEEHSLPIDWITAQGETRMATLLTDVAVGRQSTILAHTLRAGPNHLTQMLERIDAHTGNAHSDKQLRDRQRDEPVWGLVSAGSLPPGLPEDSHAQIIARAGQQGLVTLLDASGPGLLAGVAARPHILKVNAAEFAALIRTRPAASGEEGTHAFGQNGVGQYGVGQSGASHAHMPDPDSLDPMPDEMPDQMPGGVSLESFNGYDSILRLAEQISPHLGTLAREAIVVTLGRSGILAVTETGIYHAPGLAVPALSPAGAGDAVSAGLMWARSRGEDWLTALIWASALAASVVQHAGTGECDREQVLALAEDATVVELDAAP